MPETAGGHLRLISLRKVRTYGNNLQIAAAYPKKKLAPCQFSQNPDPTPKILLLTPLCEKCGLGALTSLENLNLEANQLSGEIPAELGNLTNLQSLYFHDNWLSEEIPARLGDLTNLTELDLSDNNRNDGINNELSGTIPTELEDLINLQYLLLNNTTVLTFLFKRFATA